MGRVKLKIKKLDTLGNRQATYGKRKTGILKKARELSVLCDVDIILLMFSPSGKPSICKGKRSLEEIIAKYAQLPPQERAKRKIEGLEALKKTFKKLDHDVNIPELLRSSFQTVEDLAAQSTILQNQLSDAHKRLSCWTNLDKVNSMEHLWQLENSIRDSLNQIQAHKEYLGKVQLMSVECDNKLQNEMQVPFRMTTEQELPPMPWITNNDGQQIIFPDDPNLFSHREVECSASSSLGSYFGTGKSSELSNSSQETGVNGLLNELNGNNGSLSLQLAGHYPHLLPFNFDMMDDVKYQSAGDLNQQESPVDFGVNGSFEISKTGYDTTPSSWASSSGPCGIAMFDEHLFSRQPN